MSNDFEGVSKFSIADRARALVGPADRLATELGFLSETAPKEVRGKISELASTADEVFQRISIAVDHQELDELEKQYTAVLAEATPYLPTA